MVCSALPLTGDRYPSAAGVTVPPEGRRLTRFRGLVIHPRQAGVTLAGRRNPGRPA